MRAPLRNLKKALVVAATAITLVAGVSACAGDDDAGDTSSASSEADSETDSDAAPDAPEPDLEGIPDVVATVDGEEISRDQFVESYTSQFAQQAQQAQMTGEDVDQDALKQQTLDNLVDRTLLVRAADDRDIEASDEDVDESLTNLAEQNGMGGVDEFLAALAEQGIDEEEARSELTLQVRVEKLVDEESGGGEPTRKEIRKYYDDLVEQQEAAAEGQEGQEGQEQPEASEVPPLKEVRAQIVDQLKAEKQSETIRTMLEDLREGATIETHL